MCFVATLLARTAVRATIPPTPMLSREATAAMTAATAPRARSLPAAALARAAARWGRLRWRRARTSTSSSTPRPCSASPRTPPTSPASDPSPPTSPALAAQGRWRLLLADAGGLVTAVSSRTYTPSAAVARLVRAREATCRWPGCTRSSESCDLDHTIAYPDGATTPANLGLLCRRHHNLKTHHGYVLTNLPHPTTANENPGTTTTGPPGS